MSVVLFEILGVKAENVDATSDVNTDAFELDLSHDWAVSIKDNSVVGLPSFTIEISNNKVIWYNLNTLSTNVKMVDSVGSDFIPMKYMRVKFLSNGSTEGTVNIELSIKNKTKARG